MIRVKLNVNGEEKIIKVKEISILSYSNSVSHLIITEDNERYSCDEVLYKSGDYDIEFFSDFILVQD